LRREGGQFVMEQAAEEIYRISNGDRWTLTRDTTLCVRQVAA
jgi:hypothetical protein